MCRAVFSVAHRFVRKHEKSRQFHERREPDRGARVVAKDEEARAEGPPFGQGESVPNRSHRVFANSEMQVLATRAFSLKISGPRKLQSCLVRWSEVGRTADEPRNILCQHIQHLARSIPPGNALSVGRKNWEITIPPYWEPPPLHELDLVC